MLYHPHSLCCWWPTSPLQVMWLNGTQRQKKSKHVQSFGNGPIACNSVYVQWMCKLSLLFTLLAQTGSLHPAATLGMWIEFANTCTGSVMLLGKTALLWLYGYLLFAEKASCEFKIQISKIMIKYCVYVCILDIFGMNNSLCLLIFFYADIQTEPFPLWLFLNCEA